MRKIVLIACVSKKGNKKAKAGDLYKSSLFKNSLAYAYSINPDKIFILSALHHLLDLETEIEPYNVTLSNVSKRNRKPGLIVLNSQEKKIWGKNVIDMLAKQADLQNDLFIILAGMEYVKPIANSLKNYENVLDHVSLFKRVLLLKNKINGNKIT